MRGSAGWEKSQAPRAVLAAQVLGVLAELQFCTVQVGVQRLALGAHLPLCIMVVHSQRNAQAAETKVKIGG